MTVNRETLRIDEELDRLLATNLDEHEALLIAAFADVLRVTRQEAEAIASAMITAAEEGRSVAGLALRNERVLRGLRAIREAIEQAVTTSLAGVPVTVSRSAEAASGGARDMIAAQLTGARRAELQAAVVAASPAQVTAIVERTTQRIVAQSMPLAAEAERVMRREIRRGIAVGENPRQVARRMVRSLEDASDLALSRAMTIARTEQIDAHRTAAQAAEEANTDVLAGWEWQAHADERLCPACLSMHGTRYDTDVPGPLGHPNCRCSRVPVTKTWEELGFPGMRERKPAGESRDDILDGMSDEDMRRMLGARGYTAWKAGKYPVEKWAIRRSADGWRDSFQVRRPPA